MRVKENKEVTQTQALAVADGVAATVPGEAVVTPDTTIEAKEEIAEHLFSIQVLNCLRL